jgi:hypothetical protein
MATNILSLDAFIKNRSEQGAQEFRTWLLEFAKRIATASYDPLCPYPLSFQVICAGWALYLENDKITDWWVAGVVPIVEKCADTVKIRFVSGLADKVEGEYQTVAEIDLARHLRTERQDTDLVMAFGQALNSYEGPSVLMQALPFVNMLKFAVRDMDFSYHSLTQEGDLITLVMVGLTEQFTLRFHFEHARLSLERLKEDMARQERRTGEPLNVDWNIFNRAVDWDKE